MNRRHFYVARNPEEYFPACSLVYSFQQQTHLCSRAEMVWPIPVDLAASLYRKGLYQKDLCHQAIFQPWRLLPEAGYDLSLIHI